MLNPSTYRAALQADLTILRLVLYQQQAHPLITPHATSYDYRKGSPHVYMIPMATINKPRVANHSLSSYIASTFAQTRTASSITHGTAIA